MNQHLQYWFTTKLCIRIAAQDTKQHHSCNLYVCGALHCYFCTHIPRQMSKGRSLVFSSVTLYFFFRDRVSHRTWNLAMQQAELASSSSNLCLHPHSTGTANVGHLLLDLATGEFMQVLLFSQKARKLSPNPHNFKFYIIHIGKGNNKSEKAVEVNFNIINRCVR